MRAEPGFVRRSLPDKEEVEIISDRVTKLLGQLHADPGKMLDEARSFNTIPEQECRSRELRLNTLATVTSSTRDYWLATPKQAGMSTGTVVGLVIW